MKNIGLLIMLSFLILFLSCTEDEESIIESEKELYNLRLKANLFEQSMSPMSKKSSNSTKSLSSGIKTDELFSNLDIMIYNLNGDFVTRKTRNVLDSQNEFSTDSLFVNLKLPKGNYQVGLLGGALLEKPTEVLEEFFVTYKGQHLFSSKLIPFTILGDTEIPSITLNRQSAQVEFNILDKTPSDNLTVRVQGQGIKYPNPFFIYSLYLNDIIFKDWKFPTNSAIPIQKVPMYVDLNKDSTVVNLEIKIINSSLVLLGTKKITNVVLKKNHITKLTGSIFDALKGDSFQSSFKAEVIQEFSADTIKNNF